MWFYRRIILAAWVCGVSFTSWRNLLWIGTAVVWLSVAATPASAAGDTQSASLRAAAHDDYDRLSFDWPQAVFYKIERTSTQIKVTFTAAGALHISPEVLKNISRLSDISVKTLSPNATQLIFTVNPASTVRDFQNGNTVVLDIQGPPPAGKRAKLTKSEAAPPVLQSVPPKTKPLPETPAAVQKPAPLVKPSTEAKPVVTPPPVVTMAAPAPVKNIQPQTATTPEKTAPALPITPPVPEPVAATPMPPAVVLSPQQLSSTQDATKLIASSDINDTPTLVATLDPTTATRTVIYQRAGYVYLLFDRKLALPLTTITSGSPLRVNLEALDLPKASGYRFAIPSGTIVQASQSGTAWKLFLTRHAPDNPVTTTFQAQPDYALGSRYLLPLADPPEPIHLIDPVVNDDLVVVPLSVSESFQTSRRMADFLVVPAAQGLVVKPLNDRLQVRKTSDGIEITATGGLKMSRLGDTGSMATTLVKTRSGVMAKSIFDFQTWGGKSSETYTDTRQRLQQTIVDVTESERNRARLELARYYFAHGDGEESLALLNQLSKTLPDLLNHSDFLSLLGAAQITSYRSEEGIKSLSSPFISHQPEIDLWLGVAAADLRDWITAEAKFVASESFLFSYPEPFYSRFVPLAIEAALAVNKDHEASDWLQKFETSAHREEAEPAISYLQGVLFAKTNRPQQAEQAWHEVVESRDRLYKIRAELALVDLGVATSSLTPVQAAERLEAMRFGWRGDDLEADILHRLGQFYIQSKNVKSGLAAMSTAIKLYPNSPLAPKIKTEMADIFHQVFLGDLGQSVTPLDTLTLYRQFHDLVPEGQIGNAIMSSLADRLTAIDLLDQAESILEDLARNRLQGDDKIKSWTKLAAIRLLDHKPQEAISALDATAADTVPQSMRGERTLLRARALSEGGKEEEATALLKGLDGEPVKLLRAEIAKRGQHWHEAAQDFMELVGSPPRPGQSFSTKQAGWLVSAATAYALAGEQASLDRLAIDYGAAMAGSPGNDTFRLLTEPEKNGQLRDLASAQTHLGDVDMFKGFLDSYRTTTQSGK